MGFYDTFRKTLAERSMMGQGSIFRPLREATVLHAQNVMDYYALDIPDKVSFNKQLGALTPPWPVMWIETGCPTAKQHVIEGKLHDWPKDFGFTQAGMLLRVRDLPDDAPAVRWRIIATSVFDIPIVETPPGKDWFPYAYMNSEFDLDFDGLTADGQIRNEFLTSHGEVLNHILKYNQEALVDVVLLSLSFCNCRNVVLPETIPAPRPLTRKEQKLPQHLQPRPEHRFHTIMIEPFKPKVPKTGAPAAGGTHASPSLHIVKGGFHTYTQEKPLFGNPDLWGKFWIPQHTRGSAEHGAVSADYEIDLSKS